MRVYFFFTKTLSTVKSLIESGLYLEFVILSEDCNRVGTVFESGLYYLGLTLLYLIFV